MPLDNDTRGWIMTCISGVACVVGASIICCDTFVRLFPRMHDFSIAESDAFLSASLSLSFGVMLFSSLYSMLPQSKKYLEHGGYSPQAASYLLIGLFLAGVIGIQILSRILHGFIPSHVVDCDHTHDEEVGGEEMEEHSHDEPHSNGGTLVKFKSPPEDEIDEDTPLLSRTSSINPTKQRTISAPESTAPRAPENGFVTAPSTRRPSFMPRTLTRTLTRLAAGQKTNCDESGPCMGYSDPCGQDCFRAVQKRGSILPGHGSSFSRPPALRGYSDLRSVTPSPESDDGADDNLSPHATANRSRATTHASAHPVMRSRSATHHYHHPLGDHLESMKHGQYRHPSVDSTAKSHSATAVEHHHHVPTNAFLSIGLQTSIAIALHKAPEGFITYATNHANPTLGFAVFMALFIHNITEGFAMSLPLYLALGSRLKAIVWSSFLGGASQPLGAGVAALWFKIAKGHGGGEDGGPSEGVYGGMFAVTAGVMTSVALSLFSESLQLSHNKGTCIAFAFLGMGILGVSFALTAK